jgi:hypothetical protein
MIRITARAVGVDNAEEVGSVSDRPPSSPPDNINLRRPANGAQINLTPLPEASPR